MITFTFTEDEAIEVANHTAFTAFHALEDDDDESWRVARLAVAIPKKLQEAYPEMLEAERLECEHQIRLLRKRVKAKDQSA